MTKPRTETSDIEARILNQEIEVRVAVGMPGPAGTIQIGQVVATEPGGQPAIINRGTPSAALLDFTIPRGEQGPRGDPGPRGEDGAASIPPILNGGFW